MKNIVRLGVALVVAIAVGASIVIFLGYDEARDTPVQEIEPAGAAGETTRSDKALAHLYFADKAHRWLTAEQRLLEKPPDPADFGRRIVQALIDGPKGPLAATLPGESVLRAFYLDEYRTAYVDLSGEVREKLSGGAETELLTLYSIVNSLVLNMDEVETVKLLVEGREIVTLAGHVDTQRPFSANMLLIR